MWYAGPGQNNNANFDTDVEAGGASEDENQVSYDDDHHCGHDHQDHGLDDDCEYQEVRGSGTISISADILSIFVDPAPRYCKFDDDRD